MNDAYEAWSILGGLSGCRVAVEETDWRHWAERVSKETLGGEV